MSGLALGMLQDGWAAFFFTPGPTYPLALLRMALGVLTLGSLISLWPRAHDYLGPDGIFDEDAFGALVGHRRFSLLRYLPPTDRSVYAVMLLCACFATCMTLGLATKLSIAGTWLTLISLHNRHAAIYHGGDTVLRLLLFLLFWSPCQLWSLDAVLRGPYPNMAPLWSLRLMQLTGSVIYIRTVYWKLRGHLWREGSAIYYTMTNNHFIKRPWLRLLHHRWAYRVACYGTLLVEAGLGYGIWITEWRYPILVAGCVLHAGIAYHMRLGLFQWIMFAALLVFV